jgi:hypothetical protein
MLSRNAASSRAIPVNKVVELVEKAPATPIHWGKNKAGMQADEINNKLIDLGAAGVEFTPEEVWKYAARSAANYAEAMAEAGYHKQIVNRLLEPFQMMKVVVTATEWDNFFWLRDDGAAQPEIQELARCMKKAMDGSKPVLLKAGQWHLPYAEGIEDLDTALKFSVARCAAISYRNDEMAVEKAEKIWGMLLSGGKVHASPFEHQATPMLKPQRYVDTWGRETDLCANLSGSNTWEEGITQKDRKGNLWSGNFKGWVQHRQLIPNHVYTGGR